MGPILETLLFTQPWILSRWEKQILSLNAYTIGKFHPPLPQASYTDGEFCD